MTIKINKVGKMWWYFPTIITSSKRKWAPRAYGDLIKLLKSEDLSNKNFILSLNGDVDFIIFRRVQQFLNIKVGLKKDDIQAIEQNMVFEIKISRNKTIVLDKKSLKFLRKGFIPFYQLEWYKKEKYKKFIWRKNGFDEYLTK